MPFLLMANEGPVAVLLLTKIHIHAIEVTGV
ncbi:hypothetical protein RSAG8_13685, partial [Rhizoctonia solani AG-8 WAC10335]